jgi:hypothetical protein
VLSMLAPPPGVRLTSHPASSSLSAFSGITKGEFGQEVD